MRKACAAIVACRENREHARKSMQRNAMNRVRSTVTDALVTREASAKSDSACPAELTELVPVEDFPDELPA